MCVPSSGRLSSSDRATGFCITVFPGRTKPEPSRPDARCKTLAWLFGRAFDQTPQYWLNLQTDYDLKTAEASMGERLMAVHTVAHA